MTNLFDFAGIAWRALGRRQDIEALATRAKPFYTPVVVAYRLIMQAHKADPRFISDATDLYNDVVGPLTLPTIPTQPISVQWIQESLNTLDNAGLDIDSNYGLHTHQAVMIYQQRKKGLVVDGWVGPDTFSRMMTDLKALKS